MNDRISVRPLRVLGLELLIPGDPPAKRLTPLLRAGLALPSSTTTLHSFAYDGMTAIRVKLVAWEHEGDARAVGTLDLVDLPPRRKEDPVELHLEVDGEGRAVVATVTDVLSGRSERQVLALPEGWLA